MQINSISENIKPKILPYDRLQGHGRLKRGKIKEDALKPKIKAVKAQIRQDLLPVGKKYYQHLSTAKNPDYEDGLRTLPFESCLIHNKSHRIGKEKRGVLVVQTKPKWLTNLAVFEKDQEGSLLMKEVYGTNSFKASNNRKIKALDRFCNRYQPLYKQRKVTLLFLTFTNANKCKEWKIMMHIISEYFKREGNKILDYVWTAEVSENLHFHYHLCIAIDRVKWNKIPERLKFESLWGQRTEIDFVKKNVRHYMAKYFAKSNYRIEGIRSYGLSNLK